MSNKYSEIMNTSGLNGKLNRMTPENIEKLFSLRCIVTEKIHGENFRVGIDENGKSFVGQKNNIFYDFKTHPNYNRFSEKLKAEISRIIDVCNFYDYKKLVTKPIIFFGELYGNGMQKRFTYPFDDGLRVRWFDIKMGEEYLPFDKKNLIMFELGLESVPTISNVAALFTIKQALNLDIENMKSQVANEPYIEGIVITPTEIPDWWKFPSRLILKYKTKRFAEQKEGKHKSEKPINNFVSKYVDFVTEARIEHAIQALQESGVEINYEMRDLQHIPKAVIADIEKEENDRNPLSKEDRKFLGSYIPKFYKEYLNKLLKEKLNG